MNKHLLTKQQTICLRYDAEFCEVEDGLKAGIALASLGKQPIHGVRGLPTEDTSGWYIHAGEYSSDDDFYQPVCQIHLQTYLPEVLKYLALPPGYRFIIDDKGYEDVWFDPDFQHP